MGTTGPPVKRAKPNGWCGMSILGWLPLPLLTLAKGLGWCARLVSAAAMGVGGWFATYGTLDRPPGAQWCGPELVSKQSLELAARLVNQTTLEPTHQLSGPVAPTW